MSTGANIGTQYGNIRKLIYNAGVETSLEYFSWFEHSGNERTKKAVPQVRLVISPFFAPFLPVELFSQDFGGLIMNCQWAKSRSAPHGSVSVAFVADDEKIMGPLARVGNAQMYTIYDVFAPYTLTQLWLDGYHVFTGYVRSVRKSVSAGGVKTYSVTIDELGALYQNSIIDVAGILDGEQRDVINNPLKLLSDGGHKVGLPLAYVVQTLVGAFVGSSLNYGTKGIFRFSDGLPMPYRLLALPPPLGGISQTSILSNIIVDTSLYQMQGGSSFWDYLRSIVPQPYMELFTESGGRTICTGRMIGGVNPKDYSSTYTNIDKAGEAGALTGLALKPPIPGLNMSALLPGFSHLIMRTCPYDNVMMGSSSWHSLLRPFTIDMYDLLMCGDFVIVTDDDVISKDLGVSDAQQYTVFDAPFTGKGGSGDAAPMKNRPSIARGPLNPLAPGGIRTYGWKMLRSPISAMSVSWVGLAGQVLERLKKRNDVFGISALSSLLNYWFRNASKFMEGTITVASKPYARPGMLLLYLPPAVGGGSVEDPRHICMYYIDNVQYSYSPGQVPTMTMSVIRGIPIPLNFPNLVRFLLDWEYLKVGPNLVDGEV